MSAPFWSPQHLSISVRGPNGERTETVPQPYVLLGSNAACDVVLESPKIPGRSLLFVATPKGIRGMVLSPTSKKSGKLLKLDADQPWRIRDYEVRVHADPLRYESEPQAADEQSVFAVTWKSGSTRHYAQLNEFHPILIGRQYPSHVIADCDRMSSVHCCLYRCGEEIWAVDLGSTNGTHLAGESIRCDRVPLEKSIRVGRQRFHVLRLHTEDVPRQLSREVRDLQDQVQRAIQDRDDLQACLTSLMSQVAERESALEGLQAQSTTLLVSLSLAHENQQVQQRQHDDALAVLDGQLSSRAEQHAELSAALAGNARLIDELRAELELKAADTAQLQARLAEKSSAIDSLQSQLESQAGEQARQSAALVAKSGLIDELQAELEGKAADTAQLRASLDEKANTIETLRSQLELQAGEHAEQSAALEANSLAIDQLQSELERLRASNADFAADVETKSRVSVGLQAELNALLEKLQAEQARRERLEDEMAELATRYAEAERLLAEPDELQAERLQRLERAEADLQRREAELARRNAELDHERHVLNLLSTEIALEPAPPTVPDEEESCISSFDFHDVLEQALESLPPIDDQLP